MKKRIIILLGLIIIILLSTIQVNAKSVWDTGSRPLSSTSEKITEEMIPIKNHLGKTIGMNVYITIPEDYTEDTMTLSPDIFGAIQEYKKITPGDETKIYIKITNHSYYDYQYMKNSFQLSTKSNIEQTKDSTSSAIGFDQLPIEETMTPVRTFNSAIVNLYNYTKAEERNEDDLSDENITEKLQKKGYSGVEELDQYYLDYYNNKYNLQETSLDKFTYSTIKEIFSGPKGRLKETNPILISLAYNYFYNKLITVSDSSVLVTDSNSEDYSIGSYMRNKNKDLVEKSLKPIKSKTYEELEPLNIKINSLHNATVFLDYNLDGQMELKLEKKLINQETPTPNDWIIPPDTGIE